MTGKQFFDWQTSGGTDDVMRLVDCLERADVSWCCIGGVAVNHWAAEPMVTRDVDLVIAPTRWIGSWGCSRPRDSRANGSPGR
jgi:hypothetical protein